MNDARLKSEHRPLEASRWAGLLCLALELTLLLALALTVARLVVELGYGDIFAGIMGRLESLSLVRTWPSGPWDTTLRVPRGNGPAIIAVTVVLASSLLRLWRSEPQLVTTREQVRAASDTLAVSQAMVLGALFFGQIKAISLSEWLFTGDALADVQERWWLLAAGMGALSALILALQPDGNRPLEKVRQVLTSIALAAVAAIATVVAQTIAPVVAVGVAYEAYIAAYVAAAAVLVLAVATSLRLDRRLQALATRAAQLQLDEARLQQYAAERARELAALQLTSIRSQVEPHFLWNTIGSLEFMMRKRHHGVARMSHDLLSFLRQCRPEARGSMSTVSTEMKAISAYMGLMAVRLGARLSTAFEIEPQTLVIPLPPLVLQTLLENAMQHGLEPKVGSVRLTVRVRRDADAVKIEIEDTGVGFSAPARKPGSGLGLRSVRAALQEAFGDAGKLALESNSFGGVTAVVTVPFAEVGR